MKSGREKGEKIMMETKLVLLGTGTPNACPDASGPSSAVVVGDRAYLVDFGPGVVRQAAKAYRNGIDALRPDRLVTAFCTHLHTDHPGIWTERDPGYDRAFAKGLQGGY